MLGKQVVVRDGSTHDLAFQGRRFESCLPDNYKAQMQAHVAFELYYLIWSAKRGAILLGLTYIIRSDKLFKTSYLP
jgi:hypothetical protein